MKRKRTYQAVAVEHVRLDELLPLLVAGCIVAIDVAKEKFMVALATMAGEVVKLFRFEHPRQTQLFVAIVLELKRRVAEENLRVAMEPTGTYGDAIRLQMVKAGVPVHMVSPKRTHDSQELFDGVRSLHDAKSAALVAKLCSMGLSTEWQPRERPAVKLRALIELREHEQQRAEVCFGRLEGMLARHWPELRSELDVRNRTTLRLLAEFPSPGRVADASDLRSFLGRASCGRFGEEKTERLLATARETFGVPMEEEEERLMSTLAMQAYEAERRMDELERDMRAVAAELERFAHLEAWMGTYTAAAMVTFVDPQKYGTARQLEKACGLNLREKSSGEHKGRLSITKRGPALVRKLLYLFALRSIQDSALVRAWYEKRRGHTPESKRRAVVAVMRKLVGAMFHVARGVSFDAAKLFDVRRLRITDAAAPESTRFGRPRRAPSPPTGSTGAPASAPA